jgi:hypothetical protein
MFSMHNYNSSVEFSMKLALNLINHLLNTFFNTSIVYVELSDLLTMLKQNVKMQCEACKICDQKRGTQGVMIALLLSTVKKIYRHWQNSWQMNQVSLLIFGYGNNRVAYRVLCR